MVLNKYPLTFINILIKERINKIYSSWIKDKRKEKWLENYNKNYKNLTLPYIQGLSERIKCALKAFKINVFFKNCHKLGDLYINKKGSEKIENLSSVHGEKI